ncbi:transmembrane protein 245 isoform X1 [Rhipicephalus sanguineus]|uniref:transmembrane protein 245 isoform X1 n=1 Tax=Rhipicephalus sanguineus TaxID=34632 RepID=UPI0020C5AC48|nr:transmembrane protein 245 isoform X1 [Rhipicephalus sanguineus]
MAATKDVSRSPFEILSFVPQGHEKALKLAVYNTATLVFAAFVSAAGVAVYFILQPFLGPLLWALLFGSVLHPFKRSLCLLLGGWLDALREAGTPLAVGVFCLPFQVVDSVAERACNTVLQYFKWFLAASIVVPLVYFAHHFLPVTVAWKVFAVLRVFYHIVSATMEIFASGWMVWGMLVGYLGALVFWWTPQTEGPLRAMSPAVWLAVICHLATVAGMWRVPILAAFLALLATGFLAELRGATSENGEHGATEPGSPCVSTLYAGWAWLTGSPVAASAQDKGTSHEAEGTSSRSGTPSDELRAAPLHSVLHRQPSPAPGSSEGDIVLPAITVKPTITVQDSDQESKSKEEDAEAKGGKDAGRSRLYLSTLVWACLLAQLWRYIWLLHLTYVPLLYTVIKRVGNHLNLWSCLRDQSRTVCWTLRNWYEERSQALFPAPVHGLWRLLREGDKRMVSVLKTSIDSLTTIGILLLVTLLATVGTIFLALQVYGESMHLVEVTSSLINHTVVNSPELQELLPESLRNAQGAFDSMLGDAYLYGRQWISGAVRRALDDADESHVLEVERQTLELWDRAYHLWVARNATDDPTLHHGPSWDALTDSLRNLDFSLFSSFVRDNIGTLMSVFESIWNLLKGNISVVLSLVTTTISILFGGGTAVLNFVLNFVVFMTALYYLLRASKERYKPLDLFSSMLPGSASRLGEAVEEAVAGVFAASFKMAAFYGLYTWLIHTLFDVKMVYIPTALASLFGAVPFIGAYWACLPAVLELWLVQAQRLKALLMLICQLAPTYFVDCAIYAEIKGGGHPFLTGLAIAGGVFCLGFQGALFGPMLLCVLIVAMKVYRSVMQSMPAGTAGRRFSFKRMFTID